MREVGFSNFQGIAQVNDDDCAPTSITNVLSNLNERIDRDQFDIFLRNNLKGEASMFKEINDVFNRYNQNYDCIYKHCDGSVNTLIKYIKKKLNLDLNKKDIYNILEQNNVENNKVYSYSISDFVKISKVFYEKIGLKGKCD